MSAYIKDVSKHLVIPKGVGRPFKLWDLLSPGFWTGEFNIKFYGARTTAADNSAAITAAIAAAVANGGWVFVPPGNFLCTADVPTIHDVQLKGPGSIQIGSGRKWWAESTEANTSFSVPMTLYIDPTNGDDANSGLAPGSGFALETLQTAADILRFYSPLIGFWRIILAAGTYTSGATFFAMINYFRNPLYISGPAVSDWDNTSKPANVSSTGGSIPTAIFDGPGVGAGFAISAQAESHIALEDIKFVDWGEEATDEDSGAAQAKDWSSLRTDNCHVWTSCNGFLARESSDLVVIGGYINNCRHGTRAIMARYDVGGGSSAGDNAATLAEGCTFGHDVWEGGNGHCDYTHFLDCGTCIYVRKGGHVAATAPSIESTAGTVVGVQCENHSYYALGSGTVWTITGGTIVRYKNLEGSPDGNVSARLWRVVEMQAADETTSGTTALDYLTYAVEAYTFVQEGQALRGRVWFSANNPNAVGTVEVRLANQVTSVQVPINAAARLCYAEFMVWAKGTATQFASADFHQDNTVGTAFAHDPAHTDATQDMTSNRTFTMRITAGNAGDSFTIKAAIIERMG